MVARQGRAKLQSGLPDFDFAHSPAWLSSWMKISAKQHETERRKLIRQLENELEKEAVSSEEADLLRLTLEFLGAWQLSHSPPYTTPKSVKAAKIEALAANLQRCIGHLERIASQGDPIAIQAYVNLVHERVNNLNSLVSKHREIILPLSRRCLSWPARISKRKVFGDAADELIRNLEVGRDTIANDSAARFNPKSKFGSVAWKLIERIERGRATAQALYVFHQAPSWLPAAEKLPPFSGKATTEEKKKWLAVVRQVLKEDFRDPEQTEVYRRLITAKSHKNRWKAVFFNKIEGEFDSLWGFHRQGKRQVVPSSHASLGKF